jgi:hypothetical protein
MFVVQNITYKVFICHPIKIKIKSQAIVIYLLLFKRLYCTLKHPLACEVHYLVKMPNLNWHFLTVLFFYMGSFLHKLSSTLFTLSYRRTNLRVNEKLDNEQITLYFVLNLYKFDRIESYKLINIESQLQSLASLPFFFLICVFFLLKNLLPLTLEIIYIFWKVIN